MDQTKFFMTLFLVKMQFSLFGVCTVTLLVFKGAGFISPTDLTAATYKWNTANLFIKMRYVSINDYATEQFSGIHVTLFAL